MGKEAVIMEVAARILCDSCFLKGPICAHLKEIMKLQLANTGIDGSKLCPLLIAGVGMVLPKPDEEEGE